MYKIRERESPQYRELRAQLLRAEEALKDQREHVAALRRKLSPGTKIDTDYIFREGPADLSKNAPSDFFDTHLSALFAKGKDDLIVQHLMFAPDWAQGCPMCSMWADGFDGIAHHLTDKASFVVVARAPIEKLRAWGHTRGWKRLRLLSSHDSSFNEDCGVEFSLDRQLPAISVFTRAGSEIRHFYTTEGALVERHHRAMDLYTPVWNLLDLLPDGRGGWMPRHSYEDAVEQAVS